MKKEAFINENKFKEHNRIQKLVYETNQHINLIQNFLDTYFDCENTSYHLVTKEPEVITKVILHFQKCGWTVRRKATLKTIQLDFSIDT